MCAEAQLLSRLHKSVQGEHALLMLVGDVFTYNVRTLAARIDGARRQRGPPLLRGTRVCLPGTAVRLQVLTLEQAATLLIQSWPLIPDTIAVMHAAQELHAPAAL